MTPHRCLHRPPGAGHALGQQPRLLLAASTVGRGVAIANPDVAALEQGFWSGVFVNLFLVLVEDAPVVLAPALHEGFGDETSPD